jgi:hypothetical protein
MFSPAETGTRTRRSRRPQAHAIDTLVEHARGNPEKALVMTYIGGLVSSGFAELQPLDNGEFELRFTSGETFLLAETTILRRA